MSQTLSLPHSDAKWLDHIATCVVQPVRVAVTNDETLERVKGIEPSYAAWEAAVLPLNYTRLVLLIIGSAFSQRRLKSKTTAWPLGHLKHQAT